MDLKLNKDSVLVFDLDDTLFKEIDFVSSAFTEIADKFGQRDCETIRMMINELRHGGDVYKFLKMKCKSDGMSLEQFLTIYRNHVPEISLDELTLLFLKKVKSHKVKTGLITDGYSVTQRNKLKSLGISSYFDHIIISQEVGSSKPALRNFLSFEKHYSNGNFFYFADNPGKDFFAPNKLNWVSIMIEDDGRNIHKQKLNNFTEEFQPTYIVKSFADIHLRIEISH